MSWRPEVFVDGQWAHNALIFETELEARLRALDLRSRWSLATGYRAFEVDEPANYRLVDGELIAIRTEKAQ